MKKKIKDLTTAEMKNICRYPKRCGTICPLYYNEGYCEVSDFEDEINNIKQQAKSAIAELKNEKEKWLNKEIEIEVNDEKE